MNHLVGSVFKVPTDHVEISAAAVIDHYPQKNAVWLYFIATQRWHFDWTDYVGRICV